MFGRGYRHCAAHVGSGIVQFAQGASRRGWDMGKGRWWFDSRGFEDALTRPEIRQWTGQGMALGIPTAFSFAASIVWAGVVRRDEVQGAAKEG